MDNREIYENYLKLRDQLASERNKEGFWAGWLATSALSTAVAIVSLKIVRDENDRKKIEEGFIWLCQNINSDGGYGDTASSESNVSTTLLCFAAVTYCQTDNNGAGALKEMELWLAGKGITIDSKTIARSILQFYGKDYTFSIPILSMLAICGVISSTALREIPRLPFELTLLPASWYRFFNLRVVSYALPALIGVGIYLHKKRPGKIFRRGVVRDRFIRPAIDRLSRLVPQSGGFLEAIPLTGFVSMCLIACDEEDNEIVIKGLKFLRSQQREDGGWPIDTDLSTWVTTLSVKALGSHLYQVLNPAQIDLLRNHLLKLQFTTVHPFNGAKQGGWGWTSYSGSVPDADDTPGAILALLELYNGSKEEVNALINGCNWLIDLQNRDGGFPTFCKGWGKLPFDRSCADLSGHALLALLKTKERLNKHIPPKLAIRFDKCISATLDYLEKNQRQDGSWLPLWFGNQYTDDKTNPVYGTAKVTIYLGDCRGLQHPESSLLNRISEMTDKAREFLRSQQNSDGSWGGKKEIAGTIEETALAVSALADAYEEACGEGINWLKNNEMIPPAPIGLYFAMLWYDEKLYPLIYHTEALRRSLGY